MKSARTESTGLPLLLWFGYTLFVVYGSLVPLKFLGRPLPEAFIAFRNIPYLQLGIESRADWVANGVLYLPLGFLTVYLLAAWLRRVWAPVLYLVAAAFCAGVATSVEFAQLFFPPRTVSLNDLLAEGIGSALGIALAGKYSAWLSALIRSFTQDPQRLFVLGLDAYLLAYLAFSFFPYDFLLSGQEIADKLNSDLWGWMLAGADQRASIKAVKLLAETVLALPFGIFLARVWGARSGGYGLAAFCGLFLGGLVELAQFFIASGVSQGLSVVTRMVGVWAGFALYKYAKSRAKRNGNLSMAQAAKLVGRAIPYLAFPYLAALLEINGWITRRWQGLGLAKAQLAEVNFLPFYYHYYTTEAIALFSLAAVAMSYAPFGVLAWAYRRSAWQGALMAFLTATVVETGKLFIQGAHPDPTNLLIGAVSAWICAGILALLSATKATTKADGARFDGIGRHDAGLRRGSGPQREDRLDGQRNAPAHRGGNVQSAAMTGGSAPKAAVLSMALALVLVGTWVAGFPALQPLVAVVLVASCAAVWRWPQLLFAILPAALPVFDLAPWSGRFFFDEFDALALAVLAVAWVRAPRSPSAKVRQHRGAGTTGLDLAFTGVTVLLVASFALAVLRGLLPWTWPDANAFNNYFSPFNSLRIAKGALWAALVWRLSGRFFNAGIDVRRPFTWGMSAGLVLTVAWVFWERALFPGIFNFDDGYRVTGPFSATHTGGAYIDTYIAAAVPFLMVVTAWQRHWVGRILGALCVLATTYALMVTYSRAGYLAFGVAVVLALAGLLMATPKKRRNTLILAALAASMVAVALPVLKSGFMQSRLASAGADFNFRKAHWADAMAIRDVDALTAMFGMGVGRFPDAKFWRSELHPKISTYSLLNEKQGGKDNTFLRLAAGESIGVEQFVAIEPGQKYRLKLDVRPSDANAKLSIPVCEKWLLASARCIELGQDLKMQKAVWRSVEVDMDTQNLLPSPTWFGRPVKLALTHSIANTTLDFDNLQLLDPSGRNLLKNGGFSAGLDHWFFSIAGTLHAHWRTHSLFVSALFDVGWIGLLAMLLFLGVVLTTGASGVLRGDAVAAASLAALAGFLTGGLLDTQIDAPRFLMLLLLLGWACRKQVLAPRPRPV